MEKKKKKIPSTFYYDYNKYISGSERYNSKHSMHVEYFNFFSPFKYIIIKKKKKKRNKNTHTQRTSIPLKVHTT